MKKYLVKLSNNVSIQIDEDELDNVLKSIQTKQFVKVRQGIFNPAYFQALIEDTKRLEDYKAINYFHNRVVNGEMKSGYEKPIGRLPDIFSDAKQLD